MHGTCKGQLPFEKCGSALNRCEEDNAGRFFVTNDEYSSQVNFCPFCGAKAPAQTPIPKFVEGQQCLWRRSEVTVIYVNNDGKKVTYNIDTPNDLEFDVEEIELRVIPVDEKVSP